MTNSAEFIAHIGDMLRGIGTLTFRRMFGGVVLFKEGIAFALIEEDTLYFKVDASTLLHYQQEESSPFTYESKGKRIALSYWKVPVKVLEDSSLLKTWAEEAWQVARRAERKKLSLFCKGEKNSVNCNENCTTYLHKN